MLKFVGLFKVISFCILFAICATLPNIALAQEAILKERAVSLPEAIKTIELERKGSWGELYDRHYEGYYDKTPIYFEVEAILKPAYLHSQLRNGVDVAIFAQFSSNLSKKPIVIAIDEIKIDASKSELVFLEKSKPQINIEGGNIAILRKIAMEKFNETYKPFKDRLAISHKNGNKTECFTTGDKSSVALVVSLGKNVEPWVQIIIFDAQATQACAKQ